MEQNCSTHTGCGGSCGGGGCGACCGKGEVILCAEERDILLALGQYAFLPVIVASVQGEPQYFSPEHDPASQPDHYSELLSALERKHLISIDPDIPLKLADYGSLRHYQLPRCGSLALTLQGQEVVDWLSPE